MRDYVDTNRHGGKVSVQTWVSRVTRQKIKIAAAKAGVSQSAMLETWIEQAAVNEYLSANLAADWSLTDQASVFRYLRKNGPTKRRELMRGAHVTAEALDRLAADGCIKVARPSGLNAKCKIKYVLA